MPEVVPGDIRRLMESNHDATGISFSGFDKALGTASDWLGAVGPAADRLMGGNVTAKAMANSTISALYGQGGGSMAPGIGGGLGGSGAYGPTNSKFLSMPSAPPGYPGSGGGMPGAPPGFGGPAGGGMPGMAAPGGSDVSQFDSQINSMMSNNLMFLALQTKVQNVSQSAQMLSNLAKTDHETKLSAVRNIRSG